jgi:hypothetical protein
MQMNESKIAFIPFIYLSESGLFNRLQRKKTKNPPRPYLPLRLWVGRFKQPAALLSAPSRRIGGGGFG